MSEILTCLENIVGVSDKDCACTASGRPAEYATSLSGLFIDQLVPFRMIENAVDCGEDNIWETGADAIDMATLQFQNELISGFAENNNTVGDPFHGIIGDRKHKLTIDPATTYAGIKITPIQGADKILKIRGLNTYLDTTLANVVLEIYDNYSEVPIYSYSDIDSSADIEQGNILDIGLPLSVSGKPELEYYILLTISGFLPRNNKIDCGCGKGTQNWKKTINIEAVRGDVIADREDWSGQDGYSYGMTLDAEIVCDSAALICPGGTVDISGTNWGGIKAEAIWYLAASIVLKALLNNPEPTQYTMMNENDQERERRRFVEEYGGRMETLINNIPPSACYTCGGATSGTIAF